MTNDKADVRWEALKRFLEMEFRQLRSPMTTPASPSPDWEATKRGMIHAYRQVYFQMALFDKTMPAEPKEDNEK